MGSRSARAALVSAVLAASLAAASPAAAQDQREVTLVTGDQVVLDAQGKVADVLPAEGRENVPLRILRDQGSTHVIPDDARRLIDDGVLDPRLFDVAELGRAAAQATDAEDAEDADGTDTADAALPVIVTYAESAEGDDVRSSLFSGAADAPSPEVTAELSAINGEALSIAGDDAAATWRALADAPGVASISLDAAVHATLDESVAQIGAPRAWRAGYDGTGTTIAVLDTGISTRHEDLSGGGGKVIASRNFTDAADADDHYGHGTHVASIAAGTGAHHGGDYAGVAPGARLLNGKVLGDDGSGQTSDIIQGMEWAVDQGADIVNMSLGGSAPVTVDALEQAVNTLSAESDTLFVVAAGNSGPGAGSVGTPGTADAALTVGAVNDADALADFSSVGPRLRDGAVKPDVTAPGVGIAAAAAPGSIVETEGVPVADGYVGLDGTSMATPHVAGAAALLADQHPRWSGERLKAALVGSARPTADATEFQQGAGRVDVAAAVEQTVVAQPSSLALSSGLVDLDGQTSRKLEYRNLGDEDVTLRLSLSGSAPDGLFTLGRDELTVPAGGTSGVTVSANLLLGLPHLYSVTVTATGEGQTVRTPGAVTLQVGAGDLLNQ
ncbi:S8 family serine peptidase [Streptomyces sp. B6B3]|uniref:S8 family serine peptidase n=1 Tax=Streptomyces sp. B6B3 TaxID=3153570 RepID=UPI00325DE17A